MHAVTTMHATPPYATYHAASVLVCNHSPEELVSPSIGGGIGMDTGCYQMGGWKSQSNAGRPSDLVATLERCYNIIC